MTPRRSAFFSFSFLIHGWASGFGVEVNFQTGAIKATAWDRTSTPGRAAVVAPFDMVRQLHRMLGEAITEHYKLTDGAAPSPANGGPAPACDQQETQQTEKDQ